MIFFLNSQFCVQSETFPGYSRDNDRENLERNEDRSQNDPDPVVDDTADYAPRTVTSEFAAVLHTISCKSGKL